MLKYIFPCLLLLLPNAVFAGDGVIYQLDEPVLINGKLATSTTPVFFGDRIITGSRGAITVKLDGNVYKLGARSRLTLPKITTNYTVNFFFGSLLAVFRHNSGKTIRTKTAVLGVRGTGAFMKIDNQQTYLCTCYGDIDFADATNEKRVAHIHAEHHNAIAFDHASHEFHTMQPLLGHETPQLIALEALAGRSPPHTCKPENTINNTTDFSPYTF